MRSYIFLFLLILSWGISGQTLEEKLSSLKGKKDLKVGLVLSGGGAKGIAHVAVIEAIEKAGIRIDYIGGTSMGAMVGGLYAVGYNAKQLDSIFRKLDFNFMLNDNIPRSARTFYEKENKDRYIVSLPFKNGSVAMPSGYSKGNNLYNFFIQQTYPVRDVNDFSKLPIPFLCVATNAENGEQEVFEYGNLASCIVASGALPGVFAPVEIDGKIYIDGGIVNNYPVEEVKKKGMDVIIGVDIQAPLLKKEELSSAVEILMQTTGYKVANDHPKKIQNTDIYIKPNMGSYNALSFDAVQAILDSGKVEVAKHFHSLEEIAKRQQKEYVKQAKPQDSLYIDRITFYGNKHYSQQYLRGKLRFNWGKKIHFNDLKYGIQNLAATGNFRTINYNLCPSTSDKDKNDLFFYIQENPDRTFLKSGIHYDRLYKTSILVNFTQKALLQSDDVFSFDFIAGDNLRYSIDYYVDKGFYTSYGAKIKLNKFYRSITQDIFKSRYNLNALNVDFKEFTSQIYIQTVYREKFISGLGLEARNINLASNTINSDEIFENTTYFSPYVYLKYDSLDDTDIPSKGLLLDYRANWTLLSSGLRSLENPFLQIDTKMGIANKISNRISSLFSVSAGAILGKNIPLSMNNIFGGEGINTPINLKPFIGYDYISFGGKGYLKAKFELDYRLFSKYYITAMANVANVTDNNLGLDRLISFPKHTGYSLGLLTKTIIGPVQLNIQYSPELKKPIIAFNLGYWF